MPSFKVTYRDPRRPGLTVTLRIDQPDMGCAVLRAHHVEPTLHPVRIVEFDRATGKEAP